MSTGARPTASAESGSRLESALGPELEAAVEARLAGLDADQIVARLWRRDPTVWSADPARQGAIVNRLGWLGIADAMAGQLDALRAFAAEVAAEGFTHAVLLGMGGSSLAPEVLRLTLGVRPGCLDLTILDDTSPAAVAAVAAAHDPRRTLFIVSSKSGSTLEVLSFERHFFAWSRAARGDSAGRAFVAITDPGTSLERLARERGYRHIFSGAPDVGGRYSALSVFGLVPAALIGADLDRLLAGARAELEPLIAGRPARDVPGVRLGAILGELARRGRDKLALLIAEPFAANAAWVEQLIAESTGKDGVGIVPVIENPPGSPSRYGSDVVTAALGDGSASSEWARAIAALRDAGLPQVQWNPAARGLGAEFMRWEIATATAGAILGVNPFDEPNVTEAKQATQAALADFLARGSFPALPPIAAAGTIAVRAEPSFETALRAHVAEPADPWSWVTALPALASPGDYLAILAWLPRAPDLHRRLERLRERMATAGRMAVTLGHGPRYLHSTGQLHKGGSARALFLLLTADPAPDQPIPGERYGFAALHQAQTEGEAVTLTRAGRRVLRVHLGADAAGAIETMTAAVAAGNRVG